MGQRRPGPQWFLTMPESCMTPINPTNPDDPMVLFRPIAAPGMHVAEGFQSKALRLVFEYIQTRLEKTDTHVIFGPDEVYVVWFAKTLQNWKALVSTTLPDGMYYEVTYNGDRAQTYIDAYKKFDNVCIPD